MCVARYNCEESIDWWVRFLLILTLRLKKCVFLTDSIKFLRHNVSKHGIQPDYGNPKFLTNPDVRKARRLLGLTENFALDYTSKAKLISIRLKRSTKFMWGCIRALRPGICATPLLCILFLKNDTNTVDTAATWKTLPFVRGRNGFDGICGAVNLAGV